MAQEQLGPAVKRGGDRIANEALCSPGFTSERLFKESLEVARPSGHLFSGTLQKLLLFLKKKKMFSQKPISGLDCPRLSRSFYFPSVSPNFFRESETKHQVLEFWPL